MKGAFVWSVRRELWEHRAIVFAPLAVALLVLAAFAYNASGPRAGTFAFGAAPQEQQALLAAAPYALAATVIVFTGFVVAVFYCLDALNAERRDRSILFWKSLPVADRTTVLAKFVVASVVQPSVACAIAVAVLFVSLAVVSTVLAVEGVAPAVYWGRLPFAPLLVATVYGVAAHTLWYAPIYAWLLLVSAWARRAPFLWAVLPIAAAAGIERIALDSSHIASLVAYRITGALSAAFTPPAGRQVVTSLSQLDPAGFLVQPGLWLGFAFAAACLAAATRLRRVREPL